MKNAKCNINNKAKGFTLVELAIVITIIGILIGGVLKGQQLIDQARLAGIIQQVQGYKTATQIFVTQYDELPGDMRDPDSRIVGCTNCAATGGGTLGDGKVGTGNPTSAHAALGYEPTMFWLHLLKANMITGVSDAALQSGASLEYGETHPASKLRDAGFHAKSSNGGGCGGYPYPAAWASDCYPPEGLWIILWKQIDDVLYHGAASYVLSPSEAAQIDRKMDDGKPTTGDVQATGTGSNAGRGVNCGDDGSDNPQYNEAATTNPSCTLGFHAL